MRFHVHAHPLHGALPSVISTEPFEHRARPVGQSCFTAIADSSGEAEGEARDKHPRSHAVSERRYKRSMAERFKTFEEFWPYYVGEHSKKTTRTIHFVGTTAVMALVAYGVVRRKAWPLLVAPLAGYGPAWFSHFFIEGNKPATFQYPLWSLKADFIMWSKIARGTMDAELRRVPLDTRVEHGDAASFHSHVGGRDGVS